MVDAFNLSGLRKLYADDATARAFLDHAASRSYNQGESKADRVLQIINDGVRVASRSDVVGLFRALEEVGCGQFVIGRRGSPTRFVWSHSMISVGRAATGEGSEVEGLSEDSPDSAAASVETLCHSFHLRPGLTVEFELPSDLSVDEAWRLSSFVAALSFDSDG